MGNLKEEERDELAPAISVRIPKSLQERAANLAEEFGVSLAQELRVLIRIGAQVQKRFPRSLDETLAVLEEIDFESIQRGRNAPIRLLRERIGLVLSELDLGPTYPTFVLAAVPVQPGNVEIPTLFASQDAEVVRLLEHPPELRRHGFDLDTGSSAAKIIEGKRRRTMLDKYKALNLWRDGTLIFTADGGRNFLSWGNYPEGPLRVNTLALIESTFLFCDLSKNVFKQAQPTPTNIEYTLGLWNMNVANKPFYISPGPVQAIDFGINLHTSPLDARATFFHKWKGSEINPGLIAFQLTSKVYEWLGLTHDVIPYASSEANQRVISAEQIKAADRL